MQKSPPHAMLSLGDPFTPPPTSVLGARGGFVWWYVELMDETRTGLVLIWSFGLPFLPGYMARTRAGAPEAAGLKPSLNVALYERGQPIFYMLRALDAAHVHWDGQEKWQFGDSLIEARTSGHERSLRVSLRCPLHQDRASVEGVIHITGTVPERCQGIQQNGVNQPHVGSPHLWTPLILPATGSASLHLEGGRRFHVVGRAYHDRNHSPVDLESLGIETWLWGRGAWDGVERMFYLLWPSGGTGPSALPVCAGFEVEGSSLREVSLTADLPTQQTTLYGMPHWPVATLYHQGQPWLRMVQDQRVDNGPFYLRHLASIQAPGLGAARSGTCEVIVPSRIDLALYRPLVRMRVSQERQNSMWLPLFEGSKRGRVGRLLRHWVGR